MKRQFVDEDSELDQTDAGDALLGRSQEPPRCPSEPLGEDGAPSHRLSPYQVRQRLSQGRQPKPDSATALALHFLDNCPPRTWAAGLEFSNFRSIIAIFSDLLRMEVDADTCRAMTSLYFTRLGGRVPDRAYCWDFKWQRHQLLKQLHETGAATTDQDYRDWLTQPQTTPEERQAFAASWGVQ